MAVLNKDKVVSGDLASDSAVFLPPPPRWLQRLRQGPLFGLADDLASRWLVDKFTKSADDFGPNTVLSVFVPDLFLSAAALYARLKRLPLVLFCHDDYLESIPRSGQALLGQIYRQASARLCVSKAMEELFYARYGVHGQVHPPIPSAPAAFARHTEERDPLVIGFAGTIGGGYVDAIVNLADVLAEEQGRLVIASTSPRGPYRRIFSHPVISDLGGLLPEKVMSMFLQSGVNALAVVQSFAAKDERSFRYNFPSKLTEYSTYGLPLLIVGPESSSASVWGRENPEAALRIGSIDPVELRGVVRLLKRAAVRRVLAREFQIAAKAFDPAILQSQFEHVLACVGQAALQA